MDDIIKSAREIALEKIEKIGQATEEEKLRWKYLPEGEKLAAKYLKQDCELPAELKKYDEKTSPYIKEGASGILVRNISLPKDELSRKSTKRAMDGIKELKKDKAGIENIYSQMRRIFTHYTEQGEQQKKQAYESLKAEFSAKLQQAVQKQLGTTAGVRIDVEKHPQFQQEWQKVKSQFDSQYLTVLDELKQQLTEIK